MRVTHSTPTTVARTSETKTTTAARPTVSSAADSKCGTGGVRHCGGGASNPFVDVGHFPKPPFPIVRPGADKQTRGTQGQQLHDIAGGVRNGSITAQESEALLKEQQAVANAQKAAMADGKLSLGERVKLAVMQARAEQHIEDARTNGSRDVFARFDSDAQRQAGQIDKLADGRTSGNITNSEASHLLGQQVEVSDARGDADSALENFALDRKLDNADKEIARHSKPGTQLDLVVKPFPRPLPQPFPLPRPELPRPLPHPLPRPELPSKPVFDALSFTKGTSNV